MKKALIILSACLLLCSCVDDRFIEPFVQKNVVTMEQEGNPVFRYDPLTCQLSFNRDRCEFRASTDNMSDYFVLVLDEIPSEKEQKVTGTLTWTTPTDIYMKKNATFEAVRLEGDMIWLWSHSGHIGLVVRMLD